jgi:hypothetical protein
MKNLILFVILLLSFHVQAQPSLKWQRSYGGSNSDGTSSIAIAADGSYFVAGGSDSNDSLVLGHHGSSGTPDYWILKLDTAGNILWQKSIGGSYWDEAFSIIATTDTGCIIAGRAASIDGDATGGGHHGNGSYYDAWIVKLDKQGNIQWQKCYGGIRGDGAYAIQKTTDGGYIFGGKSDSISGDVTRHMGNDDYWIVKLSNTGAIQWQKSFGGSYYDLTRSIVEVPGGGYLALGYTGSTNGDIPYSRGADDYFLVMLDANGNVKWRKVYGGSLNEEPYKIISVKSGGFLIAGASPSTDGELSFPHAGTAWVIKIDTAGVIQWQKTYGGSTGERLISVKEDGDGGFIFVGDSYSNDGGVIGHHGTTVSSDIWLLKTDSVGNMLWNRSYGGVDYENATDITIDNEGNYVVSGVASYVDGDVTKIYGSLDYWILKIGCPLPVKPTVTISNGILYSSSANGNQWFRDGQLIPGATGQSYSPAGVGGNYTVRVRNGCGDAWAAPTVITGIKENTLAAMDIQIIPNPVRGSALVKYDLPAGTQGAVLNLYDIQGRIVYSTPLNRGQKTTVINSEALVNGVYLIDLAIDGVSTPKKKMVIIK